MIQSTNTNKEKYNKYILVEMKNDVRDSIGKKLFSPTWTLPANILNLEYTGSEESNKRNERNQL